MRDRGEENPTMETHRSESFHRLLRELQAAAVLSSSSYRVPGIVEMRAAAEILRSAPGDAPTIACPAAAPMCGCGTTGLCCPAAPC